MPNYNNNGYNNQGNQWQPNHSAYQGNERQQGNYQQAPQTYGQQQRQELDPNTSFSVAADVKQSKYQDGDYISVRIKYRARQAQGSEFSVNMSFGRTKFQTVGGYKVLDVKELEELYYAIGAALGKTALPLQPQYQAPKPQYQSPPVLYNQQQITYHPAQVAPVPVTQPALPPLNTFGEVMALVQWDMEAAVAYCKANNLNSLIPQPPAAKSAFVAPPLTASDLDTDTEIPY